MHGGVSTALSGVTYNCARGGVGGTYPHEASFDVRQRPLEMRGREVQRKEQRERLPPGLSIHTAATRPRRWQGSGDHVKDQAQSARRWLQHPLPSGSSYRASQLVVSVGGEAEDVHGGVDVVDRALDGVPRALEGDAQHVLLVRGAGEVAHHLLLGYTHR